MSHEYRPFRRQEEVVGHHRLVQRPEDRVDPDLRGSVGARYSQCTYTLATTYSG